MDATLDRVREVARLKNITSGRLSRETGISPSTMHYLMHKGKRPTPEIKKLLIEWLDTVDKNPPEPSSEKHNNNNEWKAKVVKAIKSLGARISKLEQEVSQLRLR